GVVGPARPPLDGGVDALGDVGRLLVDRHHHATGVAVEAVRLAVVADGADGLPGQFGDLDIGGGADLAGHHDQPRRQQRLAGHPARRVFLQDGVEDRVTDLVGHLVGVTLGHRLRREPPAVAAHGASSALRASAGATRSQMASASSIFGICGNWSAVPSGVISTARLVSTSKPEPGAVTSLATIRSTPLAAILAAACSTRRSVSAANPTRHCMNFFRPSSARMSVVGSRTISGGPDAFLILWAADALGRKSATAAAMTTTSTSA